MNIYDSFKEAIILQYKSNNPKAAQKYYEAAWAHDDDQCDILRGILSCTADQQTVSASDLGRLLDRDETFGALCRHIQIPECYPILHYNLGWMNYTRDVTTLTRLYAVNVMRLALNGEFEGARDVLRTIEEKAQNGWDGAVNANHIEVDFARALLYFTSKRWHQVLEYTEPLLHAPAIDSGSDEPIYNSDGSPAMDLAIASAGYLMSGIAAAHLGRNSEAYTKLKTAATSDNIYIVAEASRIMGLISRGEGKTEQADEYLSHAVSVVRTPEIDETLNTPTQRINVTSQDMIERRSSYWDVTTEPSLKETQAEEAGNRLKDILDQAEEELDRQIGMAGVKAQVRELKTQVRFNKALEERGMEPQTSTNHLILTGPPGTGKTTIARVIAKIYAGYGLIDDPQVVETSRSDFVAQYEGQSAPKTRETFESARGKVLFIDEAYDMVQDRDGRPDAFGQEAVNELLQQMENHRDDTIVVIAGYEGDIKRFLETNEGLNSRFANWIKFESYSPDELAQIAKVIAESRNNIFTEGAYQAMLEKAQSIQSTDHNGTKLVDKLGNGRFARNVVESSEKARLSRFLDNDDLDQLTNEELTTLTAEDVSSGAQRVISQVL